MFVRDVNDIENFVNNADLMNAVAASEIAMNAVAASETAMNAVAASETAMNAVAASETASSAVISSNTARAVVFQSDTGRPYLWTSQNLRNKFYLSGLQESEIPYFVELLKYIQNTTPKADNIPWHYAERQFAGGTKIDNTYYFPSGDGNYYYTTTDFTNYSQSGSTDSGFGIDIAYNGGIVFGYGSNLKVYFKKDNNLYSLSRLDTSSWEINNDVSAIWFPGSSWNYFWYITWNDSQILYAKVNIDSTVSFHTTTSFITSKPNRMCALIGIADANGNEFTFGIRSGRYYWE